MKTLRETSTTPLSPRAPRLGGWRVWPGLAALALGAFVGISPVSAQPLGPRCDGSAGRCGKGGPGGPGAAGFQYFRLVRALDLTEAQEVQVVRARRELAEQHAALRADMAKDLDVLMAELAKPNPDAAVLRALIDQRSQAMTKIAHSAAEKFLEVHRTLTEAQRQALVEETSKLKERWDAKTTSRPGLRGQGRNRNR